MSGMGTQSDGCNFQSPFHRLFFSACFTRTHTNTHTRARKHTHTYTDTQARTLRCAYVFPAEQYSANMRIKGISIILLQKDNNCGG